jgi:hypothetical protein
MSDAIMVRDCTTFVCDLPPGAWQMRKFGKMIVLACPEHPPRVIHPDGTVEIVGGGNKKAPDASAEG